VQVRPAEARDLEAIRSIVNREIAEGGAHFGLNPLSAEEVRAGFDRDSAVYPWFVAEGDDRVIGFAKGGAWKPRGAYEWAVEIGVYVDADCRGRGAGRALYDALLPELERRGFRCVIGGIALPNEASIRLHEAVGMTHIGTLPSVGYKHGRWRDVGYWVLLLGDGAPEPIPGLHPDSG